MCNPKHLLALGLLLISYSLVLSQTIFIDEIEIFGNDKTNDRVILREITIKKGDQFEAGQIPIEFNKSRNNLMNTGLFNQVNLNWKQKENRNIIEIELVELWYIYPVAIIELADRNFNVWWNEEGRDLDRVNIGGRLDYLNVTGNRDKAKIKLQLGYTQKYELVYSYPYLNTSGTLGLTFAGLYSRNKEVGFRTKGNKLDFYRGEDHIYNRFRVTTALNFRPGYWSNNIFKFEFYRNTIGEEIAEGLNPQFYNGGRASLNYFVLEYIFNHNTLNHNIYPLDGAYFGVSLRKEGIGVYDQVDLLTLTSNLTIHDLFAEKWSSGIKIKGRYQFLRDNPGYFHYTALGYGSDQLRGYEYYVIDGLDYIYARNHVKWEFLNRSWSLGKAMLIPQFRQFLVRAYLVASFDMGYVESPYFNQDNRLSNSFLFGGGPALHVLLYNNFLFRLEYSLNRDLENGLFLHFNASF